MRLCIFLHGAEVPPSPGLHILEARSLFTSHALYKGHQTFVFVIAWTPRHNTFSCECHLQSQPKSAACYR
uniref:Uncharacterized protein n=1 Tax=Anguilla anguilla TaxID=7936 RepID=A0A0E9S2A8_ANGAN